MSIDSEPGGVRIRKTHTVGGGWCLWKIEMLCNGRWHPEKKAQLIKEQQSAIAESEKQDARKQAIRDTASRIRDKLYLKETTYAGVLTAIQSFEARKF